MMSVSRMGGWVVVAVLAFGQSACTSLLPLEAEDVEALLAAIEVGDRLSILDSHGVTTDLVVTTAEADFIEGTRDGGQPVRIATAEVREIREQRVAPGKTIALGLGVAFAVFVQSMSQMSVMCC